MPPEDASLIDDLREFLLAQDLMEQARREAILGVAFGRSRILHHIDTSGPTFAFVSGLVDRLFDFGEIEQGRHAAVALLEVIRENVGVDHQRRIDLLCERIRSPGDSRDLTFPTTRFAEPASETNAVPVTAPEHPYGITIAPVTVVFPDTSGGPTPELETVLGFVFSKGVEQGRLLAQQTELNSKPALEEPPADASIEHLLGQIVAHLGVFDFALAFGAGEELDRLLERGVSCTRKDLLAEAYASLANLEVIKYKQASAAGEVASLARAHHFLSRARDSIRS